MRQLSVKVSNVKPAFKISEDNALKNAPKLTERFANIGIYTSIGFVFPFLKSVVKLSSRINGFLLDFS